jgi:hypothetical protein
MCLFTSFQNQQIHAATILAEMVVFVFLLGMNTPADALLTLVEISVSIANVSLAYASLIMNVA